MPSICYRAVAVHSLELSTFLSPISNRLSLNVLPICHHYAMHMPPYTINILAISYFEFCNIGMLRRYSVNMGSPQCKRVTETKSPPICCRYNAKVLSDERGTASCMLSIRCHRDINVSSRYDRTINTSPIWYRKYLELVWYLRHEGFIVARLQTFPRILVILTCILLIIWITLVILFFI